MSRSKTTTFSSGVSSTIPKRSKLYCYSGIKEPVFKVRECWTTPNGKWCKKKRVHAPRRTKWIISNRDLGYRFAKD
ncbi:hypothetical protein [Mumia flava]|uniref:hypothetical protein n=1 Tax=Mumia flava TaxID=1348852 RepID=UPI0012FE65D3|nr:hypothetical protein [Mumia flava]